MAGIRVVVDDMSSTSLPTEEEDDEDSCSCPHSSDGGHHEKQENKGAMSIFMLGKTYRWVSRAKVAAWFREAFGLKPTSSECVSECRNKKSLSAQDRRRALKGYVESNTKSAKCKKAKVFYQLPQRSCQLTLEQDVKEMFKGQKNEDDKMSITTVTSTSAADDVDSTVKQHWKVTKWMRSSSGVFAEDYLNLVHEKLMKDAVKQVDKT